LEPQKYCGSCGISTGLWMADQANTVQLLQFLLL